jgi:hypothetical protein
MTQLVRRFVQIARTWWRQDRIRISPREGGLLNIQPGDLLSIGETQAEVQARSVLPDINGLTLCLDCCTASGLARLSINVTANGKPSALIWEEAHRRENVAEHDLEIWCRTR